MHQINRPGTVLAVHRPDIDQSQVDDIRITASPQHLTRPLSLTEQNIELTLVEFIHVPDHRRALNQDVVANIAMSLKRVGMVNPITVRLVDKVVIEGEGEVCDVPVLVAGAHRLAAAKLIGMDMVPVIYMKADDNDARLWEIAENLHRAELTVTEHSEHVAEYARLVGEKVAQLAPPSDGQHKRGEREAARQLGLERRDVQRSKTIAAIAPEAKAAAKEAGLDDNQSALLKVAAETTPEAQVAKIVEIKTAKKKKSTHKEWLRAEQIRREEEFKRNEAAGKAALKQIAKLLRERFGNDLAGLIKLIEVAEYGIAFNADDLLPLLKSEGVTA